MSTSDFILPSQGLDISHLNGTIDWNQVAAAGYGFAFIKCSDGVTFRDPKFGENVSGAIAAGIAIGAYHFLRPGDQAADQVKNFLGHVDAVGGPSQFQLGASVDVEDPDDQPGAWNPLDMNTRVLKVAHFLTPVDAAFSQPSFIYCGPPWWKSMFGDADFSGNPLWAAHPGAAPNLAGTCWDDWVLWQYDWNGSVPGIPTPVDLDESQTPSDGS